MTWKTTQPSLLLRVRDHRDHAAWSEFEEQYGDLIVHYSRRCGLQQSDAEDVRQIVLMNLASGMKHFRYEPDRGRFRTYLGRIVRNSITRYATRRGKSVRAAGGDIIASIDRGEEIDPRWEEEWVRHHLRKAMGVVRETHDPRTVSLFERLLEGLSVPQVARQVDMNVNTVHKVKQRLVARLRSQVARQIDEEERGWHG